MADEPGPNTLVPGCYMTIAELQSGTTDRRDDRNDLYLEAIYTASRMIDDWCSDVFWSDPNTLTSQVFTPNNAQTLLVGSFVDNPAMLVEVDYDADGVFETALTAAEWSTECSRQRAGLPADQLRARGLRGWPAAWREPGMRFTNPHRFGGGQVKVTAQWGWAETPWQVKAACRILARDYFKAKDLTGSSAGGLVVGGRGGGSRFEVEPFNQRAEALLCRLRRVAALGV